MKEEKPKKPVVFKLPKQPAACADMLYELREQRLVLQKQVDLLAVKEAAIRDYFVETLPKSQASGIAGRFAVVRIDTKTIPQVEDWNKFYAYVKKNNRFDLMQRRLADGAVKEMWENEKPVPGVGKFIAKTVSCTKIPKKGK